MRSFLKSRYPGLWTILVKLRTGTLARSIGSLPNLVNGRLQQARQKPYFFADVHGSMGMGAILSTAVGILHYCDKNNLRPHIKFTSANYSPDAAHQLDWLPQHFIRKNPTDQDVALDFSGRSPQYLEVNSSWDLSWQRWDDDLTIQQANLLFHRYLGIQPEILEEAEQFADTNFRDSNILGVHFRGTDKFLESPRIRWEVLVNAINQRLADSPAKIFVATDEPEFLDFMVETYGRETIIDLDCQEIYTGSRPAHFTDGDPFVKAREALLTMLLLAKCQTCIRSASHLSAWSKILNLEQEVIMLARPIGSSFHFPDRQIWEGIHLQPEQTR